MQHIVVKRMLALRIQAPCGIVAPGKRMPTRCALFSTPSSRSLLVRSITPDEISSSASSVLLAI